MTLQQHSSWHWHWPCERMLTMCTQQHIYFYTSVYAHSSHTSAALRKQQQTAYGVLLIDRILHHFSQDICGPRAPFTRYLWSSRSLFNIGSRVQLRNKRGATEQTPAPHPLFSATLKRGCGVTAFKRCGVGTSVGGAGFRSSTD